ASASAIQRETASSASSAMAHAATSACSAAMPSMPSMKFQMLTSTMDRANATSTPTHCPLPPYATTASRAEATACTASRDHGVSGRWSSSQPIPATSSRPVAASAIGTLEPGLHHASRPMAASMATTMPMPPPRGVATTWLRRSPGWSSRSRRIAYRLAASVPTRLATNSSASQAAATGNPGTSDHRVVQQRLDRAPLLAARALPVVAARAETAAIAAIAGVAHQQLVGDVLEVLQGRGRIGTGGEGQVDQGGLATYRRAVLGLAREIGAGFGDAVLRLDQPRQREHRRDAAVVLAHLRQEVARAGGVAAALVGRQQRRQHLGQEIRIVPRRALEGADRGRVIAGVHLDASLQDAGAHEVGIGGVGARHRRAGAVGVSGGTQAIGQFALELADQLAHRLAGGGLVAQGILDRLGPAALGLEDAE